MSVQFLKFKGRGLILINVVPYLFYFIVSLVVFTGELYFPVWFVSGFSYLLYSHIPLVVAVALVNFMSFTEEHLIFRLLITIALSIVFAVGSYFSTFVAVGIGMGLGLSM